MLVNLSDSLDVGSRIIQSSLGGFVRNWLALHAGERSDEQKVVSNAVIDLR